MNTKKDKKREEILSTKRKQETGYAYANIYATRRRKGGRGEEKMVEGEGRK